MTDGPGAHIPFNRPASTGRELASVQAAVALHHLAADGIFTRRCSELLERELGAASVLMVHSCTAALELSAILLDVGPGDEVIMPSFTFVTTATAFVLRGATPVFVDIRPDTLNLDESLVERAITNRTRAIVPVHYAGVGCEMDTLGSLSRASGVPLVEDAAQGWCATYQGRPLGAIGGLGALSFHETKNVTSGHGGALIVNAPDLAERAQVLRDKGTNRLQFTLGQVDKYTWVDLGSSFAISDLAAAFLWPQLEESAHLTAARMASWARYHVAFERAELDGLVRRPIVPAGCHHNAHMYYLLMQDRATRDAMIERLAERNINAVFHYIPLHSSPAGRRYGRPSGRLAVTDNLSGRLIRLPLWTGMPPETVDAVVAHVTAIIDELALASPRSLG